MKKFKEYLIAFIDPYVETQVTLYATQAAFFLIISAVPFVMFLLSLLKFIFPLSNAELLDMIDKTLPNSIEYFVSQTIHDLYAQSSLSLTSITAVISLWAASKSTFALAQGLNAIYQTARKRNYLHLRLSAIFDTLLLMIALLASLLLSIFGNRLDDLITKVFPYKFPVLSDFFTVRNIVSFILISAIFTFLYTALPDKVLKFYHQIPGAMAATFSWLVFSWIFDYYMSHFSSYSIVYGVLASTVLLMIWLQICMIIFLCGAHINVFLYEKKHGYQDFEK